MNDAILGAIEPTISGPPHPRPQPSRDEYARFCSYCGAYFVEKKAQRRPFRYCLKHRNASWRAAAAARKKNARLLKKTDTTALVQGDGCDLAPVGTYAVKRICANERCRLPFVARHKAAIYCGLDCYSTTRHYKRGT